MLELLKIYSCTTMTPIVVRLAKLADYGQFLLKIGFY